MTFKRRPPRLQPSHTLRIRLCGKDDAPLSMKELRDGLYQAAHEMLAYQNGYRAKTITLYLTVINDDGQPVRLNPQNEIKIYPYKCAADDFGA